MTAGFLNLFSRSVYRGGLSRLRNVDPASEEYKRVQEERERFAAAAIAFCWNTTELFTSIRLLNRRPTTLLPFRKIQGPQDSRALTENALLKMTLPPLAGIPPCVRRPAPL